MSEAAQATELFDNAKKSLEETEGRYRWGAQPCPLQTLHDNETTRNFRVRVALSQKFHNLIL